VSFSHTRVLRRAASLRAHNTRLEVDAVEVGLPLGLRGDDEGSAQEGAANHGKGVVIVAEGPLERRTPIHVCDHAKGLPVEGRGKGEEVSCPSLTVLLTDPLPASRKHAPCVRDDV
jgi:hypothetical protein